MKNKKYKILLNNIKAKFSYRYAKKSIQGCLSCRLFMFKYLYISFITVILFFILSCNFKTTERFSMLSGYISWHQKDLNNSMYNFLKAYQLGVDKNDAELKTYADFALASVYIAQNENKAALQKLSKINLPEESVFKSSVYYQLGIIAFKEKKYSDAVNLFKKALKEDPKSLDIKINYELSKKYLDEISNKKTYQDSSNTIISEDESDYNIILNLIRKKELEQWEKNNVNLNSKNAYDY